MDITTFIGVAGGSILLIAFIANEFKKLSADSFIYEGLNLIGGFLLAWYAVLLHSVPFIILESIWALVAFRNVLKHLASMAKNR